MSKVLFIEDFLIVDQLACRISGYYMDWHTARQQKISEWQEIQSYIFATDTSKTTNSKLPWSNKTTIPKLCQIRDNLFANYMATMFPKRKWLIWEGSTESDETPEKKKAIESYMGWVIDRPEFYNEMSKVVLDYIDYGNAFVMPEWVDGSNTIEGEMQVGYIGPTIRRISPLDIVFNPTAPSFKESPKIIKSLVSLGELKKILTDSASDHNEREDAEALYKYLRDTRDTLSQFTGDSTSKDRIFEVAGFDSFQRYMSSDMVEILTFYGDVYVQEKDEFMKNQVIKIVDRHKIFSQKTNPSFFGSAPIYHAGWRIRPDNLWAMGPLDNLVGMQYRIDHLENMKADCFDLIAYPPIKIKGYVETFKWGPGEKIITSEEGDVELMSPDVQALQADNQIALLEAKMEEMAGSPKEAMGFRTPGEKTKYEVQQLENAASRIYQNKISHLEAQVVETSCNAMLELGRRLIDVTTIRVFDEQFNVPLFKAISAQDLTGNGRIRPVAARHFAEQAQQIQNLSGFFASAVGADPSILAHFSSVGLAKLFESLLDIEDYHIVSPYVRLSEQAEAQQLSMASQEQIAMESTTPSGIFPDDSDEDALMNTLPTEGASDNG